ncbi:MAG: sensor histidine kinase [Eubacteriales bacterium]|nr:sensor histidine kinase [Eubacteriales bacterium]
MEKKEIKGANISWAEFLLLMILFFCYAATVFFLFQGSFHFVLLFFVLHSCIGLVYFRISQNRLMEEYGQVQEVSYERSLQKQMLAQKEEALGQLRKKNEACKREIEELGQELEEVRSQLREARQEAAELAREHESSSGEDWTRLLPAPAERESLPAVDLAAAVLAVMEEMKPFAGQAGITLQLSSGSSSAAVAAEPELLRILFRNIIDNSIKYMRRPGRLVITVSNVGEELFIVAKDNGEGLAEEETKRIFERGYQGANRVSGNGLGLTQVKAIVLRYGGTIYAKSGIGNGMAVYIQLPCMKYGQGER